MEFHVRERSSRGLSIPVLVYLTMELLSAISLVSAANLSSTESAVIILGLRLKGQDRLLAQ